MIHRRLWSFSEAMHYINNAQLLMNNSNNLYLTTKKLSFYSFILNKTNAKIVKPIFCVFFFILVNLGHTEASLATHVLQFIFLSDCGFRFPIAQFPSGQCSPSDLYLQFWKGVGKMEEIGFKYVISSSGNSSSPPFYGFNIGYCYVLELPLDLIFLPCFKHS